MMDIILSFLIMGMKMGVQEKVRCTINSMKARHQSWLVSPPDFHFIYQGENQ